MSEADVLISFGAAELGDERGQHHATTILRPSSLGSGEAKLGIYRACKLHEPGRTVNVADYGFVTDNDGNVVPQPLTTQRNLKVAQGLSLFVAKTSPGAQQYLHRFLKAVDSDACYGAVVSEDEPIDSNTMGFSFVSDRKVLMVALTCEESRNADTGAIEPVLSRELVPSVFSVIQADDEPRRWYAVIARHLLVVPTLSMPLHGMLKRFPSHVAEVDSPRDRFMLCDAFARADEVLPEFADPIPPASIFTRPLWDAFAAARKSAALPVHLRALALSAMYQMEGAFPNPLTIHSIQTDKLYSAIVIHGFELLAASAALHNGIAVHLCRQICHAWGVDSPVGPFPPSVLDAGKLLLQPSEPSGSDAATNNVSVALSLEENSGQSAIRAV